MGGGRWSPTDWTTYSSATKTKPLGAIYRSRKIDEELDPLNVKLRESRDSDEHPKSNAIIVGLDVTGSMGMLAEVMAKKGLGTLIEQINDRKPVPDPAILIMAIGDARWDNAPLQVTQFESSNVLVEQLEKIFVEHGGGGNMTESYDLPWYFAAQHTSIDCFEKRNKKGYLFTIGDEQAPAGLDQDHIKRFIGDTAEREYSAKELLEMAQRMYHVFHIVAEEGDYATHAKKAVYDSWRKLLGQNVRALSDHTKLAEVIVSIIQIMEGEDNKAVAASWDGDTSLVVANATKGLTKHPGGVGSAGVVRLS